MPSPELRIAKLANTKDSDTCVLRIEAAPNDARRAFDELGSATNERFRRRWVTEDFSGIERLCRGTLRAAVLGLPLPGRHGVEGLDNFSEVEPRVPILILSGTDREEKVPQAIERETRNYLMNHPDYGCRFRQRCTR